MKKIIFFCILIILKFSANSQLTKNLKSNFSIDSLDAIKEIEQNWVYKKNFMYFHHGSNNLIRRTTNKLILLKNNKVSKVFLIGKVELLYKDSLLGILKITKQQKKHLNSLIKQIKWNDLQRGSWQNFKCINKVDTVRNFYEQLHASVGIDAGGYGVIIHNNKKTRVISFEGWNEYCTICKDPMNFVIQEFLDLVFNLDKKNK
jgi:hypothetical protein